MSVRSRLTTLGLVALPAASVVYLSFESGGYFPRTQSIAGLLLLLALLLRTLFARHPLEGFSLRLGIAAGALALFAGWTLLSASWSDSPARAMLEFDRVLLYLLALLLFGSLAGTPERVRWVVRGVLVGIVVVCTAGLITRLLPDVWPIDPDVANNRLGYPLGYWNAAGLLAALGIVLSVHLAASHRQHPAVRILGAAAVPVLSATLFFTFSRGAIVAGAVGLIAYIALARPRGLLGAAVAILPTAVAVVVASYGAELLATKNPTSPAAVEQGQDVALVVAICVIAAAGLRALMLPVDARMARIRLAPRLRRRVIAASVLVPVVAGTIAFLALDGPAAVGRQYDEVVEPTSRTDSDDFRTRLTDVGYTGRLRLDHWDVALERFEDRPAKGHGAGMYKLLWTRYRPHDQSVEDAHSLYVEVMAELGVVGLLLLVVALGTILVGVGVRCRGRSRAAFAAVCAAGVAWAVRAAMDWDWEVPAVTLWLFMAGGLALAATPGQAPARLGRLARGMLAVGWLALAIPFLLVGSSQRDVDRMADAFDDGDCAEARAAAGDAISTFPQRPEPYQFVAYCDIEAGRPRAALDNMRKAEDRDPHNWKVHYGLAVARAASGLDPRPAVRTAVRLNRRGELPQEARELFGGADPARWRRAAEEADVPKIEDL